MSVDREGTFQANIVAYGLKEMESGAVAVSIKAALTTMWSGEEWDEWSQYGQEAEGDIWIVKKDGSPNTGGVESLARYAGWDGSIDSILNGTWQPTPVAVVVKRDDYKNETRYKIAFVNDHDRRPGALSNVSPEAAQRLSARHGSQLRAIAANARRNGGPANGQPATPPAPAARPTPPPPPGKEEEIPF